MKTLFNQVLNRLNKLKPITLLTAALVSVCLVLSAPTTLEAKPTNAKAKSQLAKQKELAKSKKTANKSIANKKTASKKAQHLQKAKHANRYAVQKSGKLVKGKQLGKKSRLKYVAPVVLAVPSVGLLSGLHNTPDPLELKSGVALVVDANTNQVLFEKNAQTALPIASITKLMTALVVVESQLDLDELLTINEEDIYLEQSVRSRVKLGMQFTRREALQLALMSSENRAANMLTRYYAGGKPAFVNAMNRKAKQLNMTQSFFVEGTGLASANTASARDLVKLVLAAKQHPLINQLSTQESLTVNGGMGLLSFNTTNRLIRNPGWEIALQKTGFINAAGQCLVMLTTVEGRSVVMIFLDSAGKLSRLGDAQRVRDWMTQNPNQTLSLKPPQLHTARARA